MKQNAQLNILHNSRQLRYMVEINDALVRTQATHGSYNYKDRMNEDGYIQFMRNPYEIDNFRGSVIHNTHLHVNTWTIDDIFHTNLDIPTNLKQRELVVYIPRYSVESFSDEINPETSSVVASNIKYNLTAYIYIAGRKVVLGSYLFDLGSAVATEHPVKYKNEDYSMKVSLAIVDPVSLTFDDDWKDFRVNVCNEPPYTNNTGSVLNMELDVVFLGSDGLYHKLNGFTGGFCGVPFQKNLDDMMHIELNFDGDATINLLFNEAYDGDVDLYLAETYGLWKTNEDGEYVDENNEVIERNPETGMVDESRLVKRSNRIIYELVVRDKEDIFDAHISLISGQGSYTFPKSEIAHDWSWWKPGLIMQGSVEIYDTDLDDIDEIKETCWPIMTLLTDPFPLVMDQFRYMVPTSVIPDERKVNLNLVNMNEYNINAVNKISKQVINVTRPADYKSNIVKPVFYRNEVASNIIIHPEVVENIGINLNQYKSKVELFHIKVEGVDFMEVGRTTNEIIFTIDGNLLPAETDNGTYYILNEKMELVTTGKYTYER